MEVYDQLNTFLVEIWSRINKIEERALAAGLGNEISVTEIHILEKIGEAPGSRMSNIAKALSITLATLTVACDKLETKGLITRTRNANDKRVVNVDLTPRGQAAFEYHQAFHNRMINAVMEVLTPEEAAILGTSLVKLQQFFENCAII